MDFKGMSIITIALGDAMKMKYLIPSVRLQQIKLMVNILISMSVKFPAIRFLWRITHLLPAKQ